MNRSSESDQSQFNYDQNHVNYVPIDSCANYCNSQRVFKNISASNSRRNRYKNPEAVLSNYQTYFVPVTDYNSTGTTELKEQSIHAHYSYSSNSLSPTYVQGQAKVNNRRNKVIYLKYPNDDLQFEDPKYYSPSNYLLKQEETFVDYGSLPQSQNYSYFVPGDKSAYKNSPQQLPKMVYSSYVPEVDVQFANNRNLYYPYSSEPSITCSSQKSIDDIMNFTINKSNYNEVPEKISAHAAKTQELSEKFPNLIKRIPRPNVTNKMNNNCVYQVDSIYGIPCDETPTKQYCTINANTQTSNHILRKENSINKIYATTTLSNECTQTEYEDIGTSRSKETQTLNHIGGNFFAGMMNSLARKGHFIYSCYLRTTIIRWLRRILIELAWSVYNCPSNCPMQDRIIFSYLNHIESKSPVESQSNECQNHSSPRSPSHRNCTKQRIKY